MYKSRSGWGFYSAWFGFSRSRYLNYPAVTSAYWECFLFPQHYIKDTANTPGQFSSTTTPAQLHWFSHAERRQDGELIRGLLLSTSSRTWQLRFTQPWTPPPDCESPATHYEERAGWKSLVNLERLHLRRGQFNSRYRLNSPWVNGPQVLALRSLVRHSFSEQFKKSFYLDHISIEANYWNG